MPDERTPAQEKRRPNGRRMNAVAMSCNVHVASADARSPRFVVAVLAIALERSLAAALGAAALAAEAALRRESASAAAAESAAAAVAARASAEAAASST